MRGPQCAGLLLGRKDLVRAAWLNSSPHHGFGRAMKVGKEEIMGMLTAIEVWRNKVDLKAEYQKWEGWYAHISKVITQVPGIQTQVKPPAGASPFPVMDLTWDPQQIGMTAEEVGQQLLEDAISAAALWPSGRVRAAAGPSIRLHSGARGPSI